MALVTWARCFDDAEQDKPDEVPGSDLNIVPFLESVLDGGRDSSTRGETGSFPEVDLDLV